MEEIRRKRRSDPNHVHPTGLADGVVGVLFLLAFVAALAAAPIRDQADVIDWDCQFGHISQVGRTVTVEGPSWSAAGSLRLDGTIILYWQSGETQAIGVYRRVGDDLVGHWGYAANVEIMDGDICDRDGNSLSGETLTRQK
jgi:hypothetical protein